MIMYFITFCQKNSNPSLANPRATLAFLHGRLSQVSIRFSRYTPINKSGSLFHVQSQRCWAQLAKKYIFQPMFDSWNVISNFQKTFHNITSNEALIYFADPATTGSSKPLHQGSGCVEGVMNLLLVVVRQLIFLHVFAKSHSLGGDKDRLSSNWLNMPAEPGVIKPCRKYIVALTFRRSADSW